MPRAGRAQPTTTWLVPPAGTSDVSSNRLPSLSIVNLNSQAGAASAGKGALAISIGLSSKAGAASAGKANLVLNFEALSSRAGAASSGFGTFGIILKPSVVLTYPPPQRPPGRSTAYSGRYKPLSANLQGYTQGQVEAVMRGPGTIWRPRFELYDALDNRIYPDLDGVTAAVVHYDETQPIKGSLALTMLPDERLRNAFGQYTIKPICGVGPMTPAGGFAEFRMGAYPWTRPKRSIEGIIAGASETWTITLGDQLFNLNGSGPHSVFAVSSGDVLAADLRLVLALAGFDPDRFDTLTWSDAPAMQDVWYTPESTGYPSGNPAQGSPTGPQTWLGIAAEMHKGLGWSEPAFDRSEGGSYIGQPDRVWWSDPPDVVYDTSDDGVVLLPVTTEPDLSKIANWGKGWTQPSGGSSGGASGFGIPVPGHFFQTVDLNDFLPTHPIAQVNAKHYYDFSLPNALASDDWTLWSALLVELFKRLGYYEKQTLVRNGFLAQHEPPGIVGVRVAGDPELSGAQQVFQGLPDLTYPLALYRETGDQLDLFTGEASSTLTRLSRIT